jgi:hypothetical protein
MYWRFLLQSLPIEMLTACGTVYEPHGYHHWACKLGNMTFTGNHCFYEMQFWAVSYAPNALCVSSVTAKPLSTCYIKESCWIRSFVHFEGFAACKQATTLWLRCSSICQLATNSPHVFVAAAFDVQALPKQVPCALLTFTDADEALLECPCMKQQLRESREQLQRKWEQVEGLATGGCSWPVFQWAHSVRGRR